MAKLISLTTGSSANGYFDVNKAGGYLIEMSVHNLDACKWAIGSRPIRASGFGGIQLYNNDPPGRTIFDCGVLSYDYVNGAKMSFTQGGEATTLARRAANDPHAHVRAFYDCITKQAKNPADIVVGATAAPTAIMGHMAIAKQKTITWDELGISL